MVQRHSFAQSPDTSSEREHLVQFRFWLPWQTDLVAADLHDQAPAEAHPSNQLPSSLRVVSSDTVGFKSCSPTASVLVAYQLQVRILNGLKVIASSDKQIRILSCHDPQPPLHLEHFRTKFTYRQEVVFRKSVFHKGGTLSVEASEPEPLTFQKSQSTATTKVRLQLTCRSGRILGKAPTIAATIQWRLKSLTTIDMRTAVSSANAEEDAWTTEIRSNLRWRHMKMTWTEWTPDHQNDGSHQHPSDTVWRATHTLWLSEDISSALTPSFQTTFLSHEYTIQLRIKMSGLGNAQVELAVPVQLVYQASTWNAQCPDYATDSLLPVYAE